MKEFAGLIFGVLQIILGAAASVWFMRWTFRNLQVRFNRLSKTKILILTVVVTVIGFGIPLSVMFWATVTHSESWGILLSFILGLVWLVILVCSINLAGSSRKQDEQRR